LLGNHQHIVQACSAHYRWVKPPWRRQVIVDLDVQPAGRAGMRKSKVLEAPDRRGATGRRVGVPVGEIIRKQGISRNTCRNGDYHGMGKSQQVVHSIGSTDGLRYRRH
jgi:hypothetical protein